MQPKKYILILLQLIQILKDKKVWNDKLYISSDHARKRQRIQQFTNEISNEINYFLIVKKRNSWDQAVQNIPKSRHKDYENLFEAVWKKDINTIKKLTNINNKYPTIIGCRDNIGFTPLQLAIYLEDMELISLILQISLEQYTPYDNIELKDQNNVNTLNNFDILNGNFNINNHVTQTKTDNVHQDINSIVSLLSPIDFINYSSIINIYEKNKPYN